MLEIKARLHTDGLSSRELADIVKDIDELSERSTDKDALRQLRARAVRQLDVAERSEAPDKLSTALEQLPSALDRLDAATSEREKAESEREKVEAEVCELLAQVIRYRRHAEGAVSETDMQRVTRLSTRSEAWLHSIQGAVMDND